MYHVEMDGGRKFQVERTANASTSQKCVLARRPMYWRQVNVRKYQKMRPKVEVGRTASAGPCRPCCE